MRGSILLALILIPLSSAAAQDKQAPIHLIPHRAVYDLSLVRSSGPRGIDSAQGRIAMEFTGSDCDGYTTKYRQVTVMSGGETGSRTVDIRTASYESGDGTSMRFKNESIVGGFTAESVDGTADLKPGGALTLHLKGQKDETVDSTDHPIFPTEHIKRLIEAARAGQSTLAVKIYDGSEDGKKIYDTLTIIGHKIQEPPRQEMLSLVPRWPVSISYYKSGSGDQTPAYTISFDLFENGVSGALKLDYGDFVLKGDLKSIEALPDTASCQR